MGKSLALLFVAVSEDRVATYLSILVEQAAVKQLKQRQSTTSVGVKMGGKFLHQHLLPSGVSPQLKGVLQAEQFFTLMLFIL
ncbi:hypothetical protein [Flavobacterium sinopsychrotolerans]|uniref:hypothetical protein n=1 Tax=Flavobacterium sinopsychrotolerans TaxID=604089 RepID=UPI001FCAE849|nr:hypothetical protein [Flavobacterium sinopsychrotolerans]